MVCLVCLTQSFGAQRAPWIVHVPSLDDVTVRVYRKAARVVAPSGSGRAEWMWPMRIEIFEIAFRLSIRGHAVVQPQLAWWLDHVQS